MQTQFILFYVFYYAINSNYFPVQRKGLVFSIEAHLVLCEVGTEDLYVMWITYSMITSFNGFSWRRAIFDPMYVHVGCVVDRVTVTGFSFNNSFFFPVSTITQQASLQFYHWQGQQLPTDKGVLK